MALTQQETFQKFSKIADLLNRSIHDLAGAANIDPDDVQTIIDGGTAMNHSQFVAMRDLLVAWCQARVTKLTNKIDTLNNLNLP